MAHPVVCIGAGQAALSCAAKLRALGFDGPVTLIGDEPHLPYQRPPLSKKYLTGEMDAERLLLRPPEWYREQNVTCLTGQRAVRIDRETRSVTLQSGETVSYGSLLIATGCRPRPLPEALTHGLRSIYTVRNIADIDAMAGDFRQDARAVVVGGGYIGLEAASVAASRGMAVTIIEAQPRILARVACAETADYFSALHRSHGVEILTSAGLAGLHGEDGKVAEAVLADGRILPCDLVIVGIGVVPNGEIAAEAGLEVNNGIVVDQFCRTADPAILAAGDCTSFPHRGAMLRLESVPHAIAHGEAAAMAMAGAPQPYAAKPWFWSDQYDVKLQIAGLNHGYDRVVTRGPGPAGDYSVWYFAGAQLLAVDAMNAAAAYMAGKRLIDNGLTVAPDKVADPASDPKAWLKG